MYKATTAVALTIALVIAMMPVASAQGTGGHVRQDAMSA